MGHVERSGVTPTHASERGRVVARRILRGLRGSFRTAQKPGPQHSQANRDAIQEITPRNWPIHAERVVARAAIIVIHKSFEVPLSVSIGNLVQLLSLLPFRLRL